MKTKLETLMIFAAISVSNFSFAQNLIPNPSFENYDTCPGNLGQVEYCTDWFPVKETPDYFNACSGTAVSVPNNPAGYQYPHSGNAYCGMVCYYTVANAREILGTELLNPLIVSQVYYISFHLNLAGGLSYTKACNKFGCKLSTVPFVYNTISIDNAPFFYTDTIVADTAQWVQINGSFIADSAYQYIAFGNFFDDANIDTMNLDTFSYISYYYIDDICLSTDEMLCKGNPEGASESNINFIKIFPNPCSKSFQIFSQKTFNEIHLFNLSGNEQEIKYQQSKKEGLESYLIEVLDHVSTGIYILKLISLDKITVMKIIIQ